MNNIGTLEIGVKAKMHNKNNMKGRNALFGALLALGLLPLAHADQTFTVTTLLDQGDHILDGVCAIDAASASPCSLRAAIQEANSTFTSGTTTINLSIPGIYYFAPNTPSPDPSTYEDEALRGDLDVKSKIIINGVGSSLVAIDGLQQDRVFDIHTGGDLTLNDVTVRNGYYLSSAPIQNPGQIGLLNNNDGGGGFKVRANAWLELNRVNVVNNRAGGSGGGIDIIQGARVTVNASTISNNRISGVGGGISNNGGMLLITDSSISDNKNVGTDLIMGGGIFNSSADPSYLEINRSTS